MSTLFILLGLGLGILGFINLFIKGKRWTGLKVIGIGFVVLIIGGALAPTPEVTDGEVEAETIETEEVDAEAEKEAEEKSKSEEEAKAKKEAEEKAKAEEEKAKREAEEKAEKEKAAKKKEEQEKEETFEMDDFLKEQVAWWVNDKSEFGVVNVIPYEKDYSVVHVVVVDEVKLLNENEKQYIADELGSTAQNFFAINFGHDDVWVDIVYGNGSHMASQKMFGGWKVK